MKEVKCTNTGGYRLTENNLYNVLREEGNFYILRNDAGKTVRYSNEFFTEEVEEAVVAARTEEDVIASIRVTDGIVEFTDFNNETQRVDNSFDTGDRANASCG